MPSSLRAPRKSQQNNLSIPSRVRLSYRNIRDLKIDPQNPRIHSPHQLRQLARSIKVFGFNSPILIDQNDRIIAGHGRLPAAEMAGLDEVPTVSIEHLTPIQARAYQIADNKLTENARWNDALLSQLFIEIQTIAPDLDPELTGFDMGSIDLLVQGIEAPAKKDAADKIPEVESHPVSRLGDLWTMQGHRLFCGNSLEEPSYSGLMQGQLAAMAFTDAPYNLPIRNIVGNGALKHAEFKMASGEMSFQEFIEFLATVTRLMARHSAAPSIHFHCMDWRHLAELLAAGERSYTELKNLCVWTKETAGMGSFYRSQHELVAVFKSGKGTSRNNIQLGKHGRNRSNVWKYASPAAFGRMSEEGRMLALHPTCKPVQLVADAILDCSARGDIVLDPFLGSGTSLIAAQRTGRACYAIELDPLYVDVAIRRWQAFTGDKAVHEATGRSFDQIAAGVRRGR